MTSKRLLTGLVAAAIALAIAPLAAAAGRRPVVVELFTSQGCDTCPPADAFLVRLADRKDVLAMSLPVTYWDMLGWKDTLATDANTRRQKAYAAAMHRGGVYTPQMIVDGENDIVGSREADVNAAIAARAADMTSVPVDLHVTRNELHIAIGAGDTTNNPNATIWLFRILSKATVNIAGGENSGHTVVYRNVVRDVKAIGMWKGQAVTLDLPRTDLANAPHDEIAVVVQQGGYGRIIGAAQISRADYPQLW